MSYSTPRVTMPSFMVRMDLRLGPFSLVTTSDTRSPFHILPLKYTWANESKCVSPGPWIQGKAILSIFKDVIAHSAGHGTSGAFSIGISDEMETVTPSFTSAIACFRLAG